MLDPNDIARRVVLEVCELPDYNSPDDQPELLTCTVDELHRIVVRVLDEYPKGAVPVLNPKGTGEIGADRPAAPVL